MPWWWIAVALAVASVVERVTLAHVHHHRGAVGAGAFVLAGALVIPGWLVVLRLRGGRNA